MDYQSLDSHGSQLHHGDSASIIFKPRCIAVFFQLNVDYKSPASDALRFGVVECLFQPAEPSPLPIIFMDFAEALPVQLVLQHLSTGRCKQWLRVCAAEDWKQRLQNGLE